MEATTDKDPAPPTGVVSNVSPARGPEKGSAHRFPTLVLAFTTACALLLRFLTLPGLTRGGVLRLTSMDAYGHLRRVLETLPQLPTVPVLDPYLNHPEGGIWIWPPLFDLLIALPTALVFGSRAELTEVTWVAALLPPFLGALSILPLFGFLSRALDRPTALLAAAVYAVLPTAVIWSSFGHADQHCAEVLAFVLVLCASAALLDAPKPQGSGLYKRGLAVSLSVAFAILVWQGAIFVAVIIALAGVMCRRARVMGLALLAASLLVMPFALGHPGPVTYISFGLFQSLFVGLVGLATVLTSVPRFGPVLASILTLVVAGTWPPVVTGMRHLLSSTTGEIMQSGGYLSYPGDWLRLIAEYRPLATEPPGRLLSQLSLGVLAVPVAASVWLAQLWRRRGSDQGALVLLVIASAVVGAMSLAQKRYVYYLAVIVAAALAFLVMQAARRLGKVSAAVALAAALAPTLWGLAAVASTGGAAGPDIFSTLERVARLDPTGLDPFDIRSIEPGQIPGVLAPWSLGHLVTLFVERPAVSDNFGYGFLRQSEVFTAPPDRDAEVWRRLVDWRCRYVLTTDLAPVLPYYAAAVGRDGQRVERMWSHRVHFSERERPMPYLRLVVISDTGQVTADGRFVPRFKVFRVTDPEAEEDDSIEQ